MATSRKILVVSALALACHFAALAVHSALASSIIEFVLIVLTAAACLQASGRASGFARRFWRLMGIAFALYSANAMPIKDRKSTRLNSSHVKISYAVFCLKKKKKK